MSRPAAAWRLIVQDRKEISTTAITSRAPVSPMASYSTSTTGSVCSPEMIALKSVTDSSSDIQVNVAAAPPM